MATYAIGDVQGCLFELKKLLEKIHFHPEQDCLWFTGDLVNRGLDSLGTLRFIHGLGDKHVVVLGNHDLHLLAVAYGSQRIHKEDTFNDILVSTDKQILLDWLRTRPLLHYDEKLKFVMTHAGLAPAWTLDLARHLAKEVEDILCDRKSFESLIKNMYGNQPDQWDDVLTGHDRWRCIINFLTRMRYCHADGRLELTYKGNINNKPADLMPWYDVSHRQNSNEKIIFGHWAALNGKTDVPHLFPLDTGCVWGNCLTAMRLEDEKRFSVKC